jgi:hypothetical protein
MPRRALWTRIFLWLSIFAGGIGLGAKLFDLLVLAGAWGASPPGSLALMPYGPRYPIDPGNFFQPLSAILLLGMLGAVISGWKTPWEYRVWLLLPVLMFLLIWIFTPTIFWPMIRELYGVGRGKIVESDAQVLQTVHRWVIYDWLRVVAIAVAFLSSVRAISAPFPGAHGSRSGPE